MKKIFTYGFGAALIACMAFGTGALSTFACIIFWCLIVLMAVSGVITLAFIEKPEVRKELTKNYDKIWITYILVPLYTAGMIYGGFAITAAAYFITCVFLTVIIITVNKKEKE